MWNARGHRHCVSLQTLRSVLDSFSLNHVEIVAADGAFLQISQAMLADKDLNASISVVG